MAKHRKRRDPNRQEPKEPRLPQPDSDDDRLDDDGLDDEELRHLAEALGEDFEIVGPDDEDEWDTAFIVDTSSPTVSVDALVQRLVQQEGLPPLEELYAFSDLSLHDAELLRRQWDLIPVARRREVVKELVALAEDDLFLMLGRMLRVALGDTDAHVRLAAVKGLWEDGESDLIGPLVQLLHNDPEIDVRAAAATALGGFVLAGELEELDTALAMRAEEALLGILADAAQPLEVRRRALESIAYSGEAGVRQLIEEGYYSPDAAMRVSAVFAMGRSADVRWRGLVRAELQNPSSAMRAEAAYACGELEARGAVNDLLMLLDDRDPTVRRAAIFALGRIGGSDARDALEAVMLGENNEEAEAAEQALEEMSFYADLEAVSLFDESEDEDAEWDEDADAWYDMDDRELGEYDNSSLDDADLDDADLDDADIDDDDE
jgi:HEAT repeat protein